MARVKWQVASRHRRKRLIKKAKGYYGARGRHIRRVKETVMRALAYATRDRKVKKREFRSLWIIRLNAAARERGLTYSQLIAAFRRSKIGLDRKQLSELALNDAPAFDRLVELATKNGAAKSSKKVAA
ncbi:MAG: 50S ribosomal protein L20 [Candidatus Omnitrophica bacterium]|nr:50S ribosomal protein L20 [Candidatus Omnitrophota bacterium]